jgi:hypothetical protein
MGTAGFFNQKGGRPMPVAKKAKSPTGKPSKKKEAVKDFEKGKTSGGKRTSAYTKKKAPAKKAAPKRKYGMDAPARRREKKAGL